MKRANILSKLIQERCVLPYRKKKLKAIKNGDIYHATLYGMNESFCILEREKAKSE